MDKLELIDFLEQLQFELLTPHQYDQLDLAIKLVHQLPDNAGVS